MNNEEAFDLSRVFRALAFWISKSIILLLCSAFSFNTFELGNDRVSGAMAAVFVALLLTIATLTSGYISNRLGIDIRNKNLNKVFLFAESSLILWLAKLFSLITGVGIANILVVFVVAVFVVLIDEPLAKQIKKINFEG